MVTIWSEKIMELMRDEASRRQGVERLLGAWLKANPMLSEDDKTQVEKFVDKDMSPPSSGFTTPCSLSFVKESGSREQSCPQVATLMAPLPDVGDRPVIPVNGHVANKECATSTSSPLVRHGRSVLVPPAQTRLPSSPPPQTCSPRRKPRIPDQS